MTLNNNFYRLKMPYCCVPECTKCTRKGIKIFMARFPTDPERKKVWIANIGKDNWKTTDLYVCEVGNMWEMSIDFF